MFNTLQTFFLLSRTQYWMGRTEITQVMQTVLKSSLEEALFCRVTQFQLLRVSLPQAYEDSIIATQVQQQQVSDE
jgi:hypothetical protein